MLCPISKSKHSNTDFDRHRTRSHLRLQKEQSIFIIYLRRDDQDEAIYNLQRMVTEEFQ